MNPLKKVYQEFFIRRPDEIKLLRSPSDRRRKFTIFAGIYASFLVLVGITFYHELTKWRDIDIPVSISSSEWHVLFSDEDCAETASNCLASVGDTRLSESPLTRASENFRELLSKRGAKPVWIAAHLSQETLTAAKNNSARLLFLGRIYAKYKVWINGRQTLQVDEVLGSFVSINLRSDEWSDPKGINIAIRFENVGRYMVPELTVFQLGKIGFMKHNDAVSLNNLAAFGDWARPFSFFLLNMVLAVAFFYLWNTEPIKQEYLWIGFYLALHGLTQFLTIPNFVILLGKADSPLKLFLQVWEVCFPLLLGLSFARISRRGVYLLAVCILTMSLTAIPFSNQSILMWSIYRNLSIYGAGSTSLIGAAACIRVVLVGKKLTRRREIRLVSFSAALVAVGLLYMYNSSGINSDTVLTFWYRLSHMFVILVLSAIVISDYKEMAVLADHAKMTNSIYFTDEKYVNKVIKGTVLFFDLKKSEELGTYSKSALSSDEKLYRAMFPFRMIWTKSGGIEFFDEGDGLKVLFPEESISLDEVIEQVIPELWNVAQAVSIILESDGISPPGWRVNFRVSIAYGGLKPVLSELFTEKRANWREGAGNPLIETARLLEIEKSEIDAEKRNSTVVYGESVYQELVNRQADPKIFERLGSKKMGSAKHGKTWCFFSETFQQDTRPEKLKAAA